MPTGAISTRTQAKFGHTTIWIPACVAVTAVAFALVSHDPIADGPRRLFAIALVQLLAGSLVFGTVIFRSSLVDATRASFLSMLLVLGGVAIHVARVVHPLSRSVPDVNVTWRAGDVLPPDVEVTSQPPRATPDVQEPSVLSSTGSSGSALQITIPPVPKDWPWWAPVGASRLARSHHLVLVATSVRTAPYFMIINSGRLRIQLTSAGIMITAPDGKGDVSERTMTTPVVTDGIAHRWQLAAEPERTTVSVDGNELWSIPRSAQVDSTITIGDTSGDREHGGSLIVQRLSYQRIPVRTTTT